MNDPHVVALTYRVECDDGFDYLMAPDREFETGEFVGRASDYFVRFEFRPHIHFSTANDARAFVDPFTLAWQIMTELRHGQGAFRLQYEPSRIEMIDRKPAKQIGVRISTGTGMFAIAGVDPTIKRSFIAYPYPPLKFTLSNELQTAYGIWRAGSYKPHFVTAIGYLVLTLLEDPPLGVQKWDRKKAAKRYEVDLPTLNALGRLTSQKGGPHSRKRQGIANPLSAEEHAWLENVIRLLMHRMGERNHNEAAPLPLITMENIKSLLHELVIP